MIGERGRELREFLDHELDEALRSRTVLICSTSDRSSMERARAAFTATAIAEAFREQGKSVLLILDSLTRFARAQREIGGAGRAARTRRPAALGLHLTAGSAGARGADAERRDHRALFGAD